MLIAFTRKITRPANTAATWPSAHADMHAGPLYVRLLPQLLFPPPEPLLRSETFSVLDR
ncbi:hypothetical protein CHLRE_05g236626v5 [Chlamydomonas reinhardtii]|uniref:Uncharacterized protein n=1 Tax=Chlamydomonas reinhardtii TaxID=3055 RepID=A0A2K3DST7_CHLRE|nr:uncharacterized protein CHLRE_05g236626v5 [Chlamydomonas reinhardtii]PNW83606.1 hypothetical protein CHLRE_05g236626v5 [Chlamydomonas reinhardtii]